MKSPLSSIPLRVLRAAERRLRTLTIETALRARGLQNARAIPTFTVQEELEALYTLASQCPTDARILEIGSYLGASTCYLAAGLRGARRSITCVDTWQNQTMPDGVRDTFGEFEKNVASIRRDLLLIRKPSNDVVSSELEGPFDLIFLDGDHSYNQTRADFELVKGLVAPNGVLVFHDSLFFEGVSSVIGEALASRKWQIGGLVNNLFWVTPAKFVHAS